MDEVRESLKAFVGKPILVEATLQKYGIERFNSDMVYAPIGCNEEKAIILINGDVLCHAINFCPGKTMFLTNVKINGVEINDTSHVWVVGAPVLANEGEIIQFNGIVGAYTRADGSNAYGIRVL